MVQKLKSSQIETFNLQLNNYFIKAFILSSSHYIYKSSIQILHSLYSININIIIQMLQRNYMLEEYQHQVYRLNLKDYNRIKNWLKLTKSNYQPQPKLNPHFSYYPVHYVFSFKTIKLQQPFINKHLRDINLATNNGFKIFATVEDTENNVYLSKLYEKKEIFCSVDVLNRKITLLDEVVLAFYILDQKTGKHGESSKLKKMFFNIQLVLTSRKGENFHIGMVKYCLKQKVKTALIELDIQRTGEKQRSGILQTQVEMPEKLGLNYFVPSYFIVDSSCKLGPCKTYQLKNKHTPYTLSTTYNLKLQNLTITIVQYDKLLRAILRSNPFLIETHHENIKINITKMQLEIGFHNSWKIINQIGSLKQKEKQKDRERDKQRQRERQKHTQKDKQRQRLSPRSKNNLKAVATAIQKERNYLKSKLYQIHHLIDLKVKNQGDDHNTIKLEPQIIQSKVELNKNQKNDKKKETLKSQAVENNNINLIYFESQFGQLIGVLKFMVTFTYIQSIKQQQQKEFNIFWVPITFNTAQSNCDVRIQMIQDLQLPGYPITWNSFYKTNREISAQLAYKCTNDNPELHKVARKEKIHSMSNIRHHLTTDLDSKDMYIEMLLQEQLKGTEKVLTLTESNENNGSRVELKSGNKSSLNKTEQDDILQILKTLQRSIKPKMRLVKGKLADIHSIPLEDVSVQWEQILGKSVQIKLRIRQYIPYTNISDAYYIPRKMKLKIIGFRQIYQQFAMFNKRQVQLKAGIPILLQSLTRRDYEGFHFNFDLKNISEQEILAYKSANLIIAVYDIQNMQFYGIAELSIRQIFGIEFCRQRSQNNETEKLARFHTEIEEKSKYFRIEIKSKLQNSIAHTRGGFLGQICIQKLNIQANNLSVKQVDISKLMKNISMKQRQMLRIQCFNADPQAEEKKHELIKKYKKNSQFKLVNQIAIKQYNNDFEINYQTGKAKYQWMKISNTDKSQNNIFTFFLDCDFMELVTNQFQFFNQAKIDKVQKEWPNITYSLSKNQNSGFYSAKIPSGQSVDILVKVIHMEWNQHIPAVTISRIQVKRNTLPYKQYKIRLAYNQPIIEKFYQMPILAESSLYLESTERSSGFKFKIDDQITDENGIFLNSLTQDTIYNYKDNSLNLLKINLENLNEGGCQFGVLLGVYSDKTLKNLKSIIYIQLQFLLGEKMKVQLGTIQSLKIPLSQSMLKPEDRIFRISTSNDQYFCLYNPCNLFYFSSSVINEPQILFRSLRPVSDYVVISLISFEQKLIKKYIVTFETMIPSRFRSEQVQIQGYIGQKFTLTLVNPYNIEYRFYFSSTSQNLSFIYSQTSNENQSIIKIKAKSQLRIVVQVVGDLRKTQFAVLSDIQHSVVSVYQIKKVEINDKMVMKMNELHQYDRINGNDGINQQYLPKLGYTHQKVYM